MNLLVTLTYSKADICMDINPGVGANKERRSREQRIKNVVLFQGWLLRRFAARGRRSLEAAGRSRPPVARAPLRKVSQDTQDYQDFGWGSPNILPFLFIQ